MLHGRGGDGGGKAGGGGECCVQDGQQYSGGREADQGGNSEQDGTQEDKQRLPSLPSLRVREAPLEGLNEFIESEIIPVLHACASSSSREGNGCGTPPDPLTAPWDQFLVLVEQVDATGEEGKGDGGASLPATRAGGKCLVC